MRLLKRGRKLLRNRENRTLVTSACADKCCDPCPNFVRVQWCCDPLRRAWAYMNRPECPSYREGTRSFSATESQTFRLTDDPSATCWRTDPLPDGNIITRAQLLALPIGEQLVVGNALDAGLVILDNCEDETCGPCPECCGSTYTPDGCGDIPTSDYVCCECGDNYTLTITETSQSSSVAEFLHPCTVYPAIGSLTNGECHITHTATIHFGCEEVDDGNGGRVLRRKVTGKHIVDVTYRKTFATIRYLFGNDAPEGCQLQSFSTGRVVEDIRHFEYPWTGGEGCGLTLSAVSRGGVCGGPRAIGPSYGFGRFIGQGECSGVYSQTVDPCDPDQGGSAGSRGCQMGLPYEGFNTRWSGARDCDGGTFSESGDWINSRVGLDADTSVNGGPLLPTSWGGAERGTWEYSISWQKTGGDACNDDPCTKQQPALVKPDQPRRRVTASAILENALNAKPKGCNCGKK